MGPQCRLIHSGISTQNQFSIKSNPFFGSRGKSEIKNFKIPQSCSQQQSDPRTGCALSPLCFASTVRVIVTLLDFRSGLFAAPYQFPPSGLLVTPATADCGGSFPATYDTRQLHQPLSVIARGRVSHAPHCIQRTLASSQGCVCDTSATTVMSAGFSF